jgi:hypothetical protein
MEFNEQKALAVGYDPITECTQVMVPHIFFVMKNIYEIKVRGKFEKGQMLTVSGEGEYSLSHMTPLYRGEGFKAEEKDYIEMVEMFADILEKSFDQRKYDKVRDSLQRIPKKIREKLSPYLPELKSKTVIEEYSFLTCLKC